MKKKNNLKEQILKEFEEKFFTPKGYMHLCFTRPGKAKENLKFFISQVIDRTRQATLKEAIRVLREEIEESREVRISGNWDLVIGYNQARQEDKQALEKLKEQK